MTLLTICQDVANEVGFAAPSSIISNTDPTAKRLLRLASRNGKVMAKKNWAELIKTHTFTTTSGEPQYNFPSDFRSLVPDTFWNQTEDTQVFLISPRVWSYEKSVVTSTFHDRMRYLGDDSGPDIGKKITLHPTPSAAETFFFQYYSQNWVLDAMSVEQADFEDDTDTVIFDEDLFTMGVLWRTLKAIGQPYEEEKTEFDQQMEICMAQSGGTEALHADGNTATLSNIPETGFGS